MPDAILGELSWAERVIVRRVRLGWTKNMLAERSGVSRMTLWRTIECRDVRRRMDATESLVAAVEAALLEGELAQTEYDAEAAALEGAVR